MNRARIIHLADALEAGTTPVPGFNMALFYQSDHAVQRNVNNLRDDRGGTVAGLEAHVVTLFRDVPVSTANVHGAATQILDLDIRQAGALFRPSVPPRRITREMAVNTLRDLAATGVVNWVLPEQIGAQPWEEQQLVGDDASR